MAETLRLAAIGDLHVTEFRETSYGEMFARISDEADALALCGDLTNFGKIAEAENLAEDLRACSIPAVAVLGNHDYEEGLQDEVSDILRQAGVTVLDEQAVELFLEEAPDRRAGAFATLAAAIAAHDAEFENR